MPLDPQYIDAIRESEGYSPSASWDYKQYSSGYGTRAQPGDEGIPPDQLKAIHEQRYQDNIRRAEAVVESVNPDLPPGAKAALTSLTYNAGPGWTQSGLGEMVRKGDLQGAQERFLQYNKAGGEVNAGLVNRRAKEAAWFGGPMTPTEAPTQAIPPSTAPVFAPRIPAQAAPQGTAQPQLRGPAEDPQLTFPTTPQIQPGLPPQAPPIFAPPRRPVDISALKAALAQHRGFSFRG